MIADAALNPGIVPEVLNSKPRSRAPLRGSVRQEYQWNLERRDAGSLEVGKAENPYAGLRVDPSGGPSGAIQPALVEFRDDGSGVGVAIEEDTRR
jgi:hypothetical protein